jgi:hypothetical protein
MTLFTILEAIVARFNYYTAQVQFSIPIPAVKLMMICALVYASKPLGLRHCSSQ